MGAFIDVGNRGINENSTTREVLKNNCKRKTESFTNANNLDVTFVEKINEMTIFRK